MIKTLFLIGVFFSASILGCAVTKRDFQMPLNELYTLVPEMPQQGDSITIYYNYNHKGNKFDVGAPLYVTIYESRLSNGLTRRLRMHPTDNQAGVLCAGYRLSNNSTTFMYCISEQENNVNILIDKSPVFKDSNFVEGAAAFMIMNCNSYEIAKQMYDYDREIHPQSQLSRIAIFERATRSNASVPASLEREVDSVIEEISREGIRNKADCENAAACLIVFSRKNEYSQMLETLKLIDDYTERSRPNFGSIVCSAFSVVWDEELEHLVDLDRIKNMEQYFHYMTSIAMNTRSHSLIERVFQCGRNPGRGEIAELKEVLVGNEIVPYAKKLILDMNESEYIENSSLAMYVLNYFYEHGDYDYCIKAVSHLRSAIVASTQWVRDDESLPVTYSPEYGKEIQLSYVYASSMYKSGNKAAGIQNLKALANREQKEYYRWLIKQSAKDVAEYYATNGEKDSAAVYLGVLYSADDPSAAEEGYRTVIKKYGTGFYTEAEIIAKYYRPEIVKPVPAPDLELKTVKGESVPVRNGTHILVFTNSGCAPCKVVVPMLMNALETNSKVDNIIMISDKPTEYLSGSMAASNDKYYPVIASRDIAAGYKMRSYPLCLIIKDGMIRQRFTITVNGYSMVKKALESI